ncbi:MAG TPA: hypothetical protein VFJ85_01455 [Acidimicrobiales bacterium]|nr:hypothetical protein [Acidimicrobiales bacterium]
MSEPLDFSKVGAKPKAQPGPPPRKRPPASSPPAGAVPAKRRPRRRIPVVAALAAAALSGAAYLAAGRGGGSSGAATNRAAVSSPRFCDMAAALDLVAPVTPPLDSAGAKKALSQLGASVSEFKAVAPPGVRTDLPPALDALEAAAGGDAGALATDAYRAHRQHVSDYVQQACTRQNGQEG